MVMNSETPNWNEICQHVLNRCRFEKNTALAAVAAILTRNAHALITGLYVVAFGK
jgi:hypothetical protein